MSKNSQIVNKKKSSRKSGNQFTTVSRLISQVQIPKPSLRLRTSGSNEDPVVVVEGMEVIAELNSNLSTGYSELLDLRINPADPKVFPRLASIASTFDRFRVKKLVLRYHCGVPSTTEGAIGIGVMKDRNDRRPSSLVELSDLAGARVGTVSQSLEVVFTSDAKEPFLLTTGAPSHSSSFYASSVEDDIDRWSGLSRFIVATDRLNATAKPFLGYLSLQYHIELMCMKASTRAVVSGILGTRAVSANTSFCLDLLPTFSSGIWNLSSSSAPVTTWNNTGLSTPVPTFAQSFTVGKGSFNVGIYGSFTAIVTEDLSRNRIENFSKIRSNSVSVDTVEREYWVNPNFRVPGLSYSDDSKWSENRISEPLAAGDVGLSILGQKLSNTSAPAEILFVVSENSTAAFAFGTAAPLAFTEPYVITFVIGSPSTRTLSSGSFSVSVL